MAAIKLSGAIDENDLNDITEFFAFLSEIIQKFMEIFNRFFGKKDEDTTEASNA